HSFSGARTYAAAVKCPAGPEPREVAMSGLVTLLDDDLVVVTSPRSASISLVSIRPNLWLMSVTPIPTTNNFIDLLLSIRSSLVRVRCPRGAELPARRKYRPSDPPRCASARRASTSQP